MIRCRSVRLGLLGPLEVIGDDGVELILRARKQRAVLSLLALRVNSLVRESDLIDALWGDQPVRTADKTLQTYISDLRKVLPSGTITTEPGGYRLRMAADDVDVTQFERLLRSCSDALANDDPRRALDCFNQASAWWRGRPLPDLADQIGGAAEATHLQELYEAGLERSFEARLALGEHGTLIADLETAVVAEPFRERRWQQLMLALYRAGRQPDALEAYQRLRKTLDEGFAIEPGEEVRALERAILNQDSHLDLAPTGPGVHGRPEGSLPSGNLTFLLTDVESPVRLMRRAGDTYPLLQEQQRIVRSSMSLHGGIEVDSDGNGSLVVFADAGQAVAACLDAQRSITSHEWPAGREIGVRMGLHTGIARLADGGYMGPSVHQAVRLCAAAHGGQILLSAETARMVRHFLPDGCSLVDRGSFMLSGSDEPERIYQLIHPDIEGSFPPLRASPAQSHNLPDTRTPFVGREFEIKAIDDLLSECRLVTIVGPGGVGKTRLAIELAARLAPRFEWGIYLCDLSPLDDAALVPAGVSAAFGVRDELALDPLESVAVMVSDHETLLLMDSCEHLIEAAGAAIEVLLSSVAGLRILATSRQPVGLDGERVLRIQPLETPGSEAELEDVRASEAVQLFESRARLVQLGFNVSDDQATVVGEICRRLEGVPLAIELAAAQVPTLALTTIAERLRIGLTVEKSSRQPAGDRHRTLEATVDWSYRLLDADARRFLRFLSVFANGFSVDAAGAVSDADDPVVMLTRLVDRSLVVWDPDATRYRLLETIRAFARARLEESGEVDLAGVEAPGLVRRPRRVSENGTHPPGVL